MLPKFINEALVKFFLENPPVAIRLQYTWATIDFCFKLWPFRLQTR